MPPVEVTAGRIEVSVDALFELNRRTAQRRGYRGRRPGIMDGYFDDSSMLRRVHRERVLALSGQRALLMQAAHPLAVFGLLAHTSSLDEPYERLRAPRRRWARSRSGRAPARIA